MNYKQLIFGIIGVTAASYAGGSPIQVVNDANAISEGRFGHPEIKLKTIFGINEEMLADTNRFPVSSCCWHEFELPEDMAGFKTVNFSLTDSKGKFGIFKVEMQKELPPESDDAELYKEFKSAVDMVGNALGIELKCPDLGNVDAHIDLIARMVGDLGIRRLDLPSSHLRVKLADGYSINIEAKDAVYVKRNGKFCLVANALVEVDIRNDNGIRMRRRMSGLNDKPVAVTREVDFGIDLSKQLSEAAKDAAEGRSYSRHGMKVVQKMVKEAESGDVDSMLSLATKYKLGVDVKEDPELVFKYSKMAADTGDARGISELASCYEDGSGTKKDVVKAAELWKKAAGMGNAWAMSRYANCLAEGIGVEPDPKQAAELFLKSASRPDADPWSILQIASFYLRGFGVEKDEAKAREWLDKLEARAEDEDFCAISILLMFYLDGEKGVGKDDARAYKMAQLAEKTDTVMGYEAIARCYKDGIGVEKDVAKAKAYIEKAIGMYKEAGLCKGGDSGFDRLKKMQDELNADK